MSDIWATYQDRMAVHGTTAYDASKISEVRYINMHLPDNLSYQTVEIYPCAYGYNIDSSEIQQYKMVQNIAVINSDNLNEKTVCALPSEDIELGSLIFWMDNYWLVCERDANTTLYTKATAIQCNHLLKWITDDDEIMSQWCVVEDGTKYLTGEEEDYPKIVLPHKNVCDK